MSRRSSNACLPACLPALRRGALASALISAGLMSAHPVFALDVTVNSAGAYHNALNNIQSTYNPDNSITLTGNVTLFTTPPNVTADVSIVVKGAVDGSGNPLYTINGDNQFRALHNYGGDSTLALQDLIIRNSRNLASNVGGATHAEHMTGISNVRMMSNGVLRNVADGVITPLKGGAVSVAQDFTGNLLDSTFNNNWLNGDINQKEGGAFYAKNFTGNVENVSFTSNYITGNAVPSGNSAQIGGAMSIEETFTGNMKNVTFSNNRLIGASETRRGGALAVKTFKGNIENSTFSNNLINNGTIPGMGDFEHGLGGAFYTARFEGSIINTTFSGNKTPHAGGAVLISHLLGDITGSRFVDNLSERGGALYIGDIDVANEQNAHINGNTFIGNKAVGAVTSATWDGANDDWRGPAQGGAIALRNLGADSVVVLENNVFLTNTALTTRTVDQSGGWGGAILADVAHDDGRFSVAATSGKSTLFYGNRHNAGNGNNTVGTYNAIHFSNTNNTTTDARTLDFGVHADAGSSVFMFDPLSSQADGDQIRKDDGSNQMLTEANLTANVTKTGAGDWILGGVSDMKSAGDWNINGGSLRLGTINYGTGDVAAKVDLSHAGSHFNLGQDATLGGTGTVKAPTIHVGGTVDPDTWKNDGLKANAIGNGISDADIAAIKADQKSEFGEIRFVGDVTWANGSRYVAQVDATGNNDRVYFEDGGGTATVTIENGSTLELSRNDGSDWQDGERFDVIDKDAGVNINGEFDIVGAPIVLGPKLVCTATGCELQLDHDQGAYKDLADTKNQQNVADALGSLGGTHELSKVLNDKAKARAVLDNLSGEIYGSVRSALLSNNRLKNAAQARMQGLGAQELAAAQPVMLASTSAVPVSSARFAAPGQRLWVNTWHYDGRLDGSRNAAKVDQSGYGLALGGDVRVNDQIAVGALFGYEDGKVKNGGTRRSRTDVDAYSLGGYVNANLADFGGIALSGGLIYSHLKFDSSRTILLPAGKAKASYDGYKVQAFVEAGKTFDAGDATVTPYVNLTQNWLHTDAVRERGSIAALTVRAQTDSVTQTTLGVRASYQLPVAMPVAVTANLGWASAFGDTKAKTSNRFGTASSLFSVEGTRMDKNRALVGVGVEASLTPNATVAVGYDGQFGSNTRDHAANVQVRVRF